MRQHKQDLEVVEVADVGHAPTLEEPVVTAALTAFFAKVP
jgi:pimeloyl-ACP methyl ester carboxylesterase